MYDILSLFCTNKHKIKILLKLTSIENSTPTYVSYSFSFFSVDSKMNSKVFINFYPPTGAFGAAGVPGS